MAGENEMFASEFILQGFTTQADLQVMFFVLFLALYMVTLPGNLGAIVLIRIDPRLCIPMCFFLSHVSLLDVCCSFTIIPRSLRNVLVEKKVISFARCVTQLFSFATWATTECHVLAAMAYHRYVATCRPLLYSVPMSQRICMGMLAGGLSSTLHTISMLHVLFCHSWAIKHLVCDRPSCSDTHSSKAVVAAMLGFNVLSTTAHPDPSWCPLCPSWLPPVDLLGGQAARGLVHLRLPPCLHRSEPRQLHPHGPAPVSSRSLERTSSSPWGIPPLPPCWPQRRLKERCEESKKLDPCCHPWLPVS
ncbi:LOW QUALITY PROTEIN: olfactory receptor 8G50-like [Ammospiza maritima maritima]